MAYLGIDACRTGWAGVVLGADSIRAGVFATSLEALYREAAAVAAVEVVGIDMPIGLPERGVRQADLQARQCLGPRRNSVFLTPPRAVLQEAPYERAVRRSRELGGAGISRQAYGLGPRILELERWAASCASPVLEVHPEVSFRHVAGHPVPHSKKTWAGVMFRRHLLAGAGLVLPEDLGTLGARAGVDDVLDAAVAAWSARRYARGEAVSFPDPPETLDGRQVAIWA